MSDLKCGGAARRRASARTERIRTERITPWKYRAGPEGVIATTGPSARIILGATPPSRLRQLRSPQTGLSDKEKEPPGGGP